MSNTQPVLMINGQPVGQVGGEGGTGGHIIVNQAGTSLTPEPNMQFADIHLEDDPTNHATKIQLVKKVTKQQLDNLGSNADGLYKTDEPDATISPSKENKVEITASGDTYRTLLNKLRDAIDFDKVSQSSYIVSSEYDGYIYTASFINSTNTELQFNMINAYTTSLIETFYINKNSNCSARRCTIGNNTSSNADITGTSVTDGLKLTFFYGNKKAVTDLQTKANRCWYDLNHTVKDILKKTISGQDYQTDYAYNVWTTHTKTFTELTTIENAFISIIGGWTTSSPHEAMIIGISGNTVTYACKGMWSGGSSGINVMITAIGA